MRTTVKASGTAANSAASPAAATATWTASLVATPAVASSPARGPPRMRQRDGHCGREYEAEPEVIGGISEQDDQTVAEYIRRGEGRVHQGRADTGALVCGQHAERAEAERDAPVVADAGRATADVTDDLALVAGHERQDQVAVRTQVVHQPGLCGLPERGGVQGVDGRRIGGLFASDEHRPQV